MIKNIDIRINTCYNIIAGVNTMPLTPKEMVSLLKRNGFTEISQNGSHKKLFKAETNITIVIPMHNKDLKKGTEQAILKQAGISNRGRII